MQGEAEMPLSGLVTKQRTQKRLIHPWMVWTQALPVPCLPPLNCTSRHPSSGSAQARLQGRSQILVSKVHGTFARLRDQALTRQFSGSCPMLGRTPCLGFPSWGP